MKGGPIPLSSAYSALGDHLSPALLLVVVAVVAVAADGERGEGRGWTGRSTVLIT